MARAKFGAWQQIAKKQGRLDRPEKDRAQARGRRHIFSSGLVQSGRAPATRRI